MNELDGWARLTLMHRKTRLFCPTCQSVELVTDFKPLAREAVLQCSHSRGIEVGGDSEGTKVFNKNPRKNAEAVSGESVLA
jgi:hypothetical protein